MGFYKPDDTYTMLHDITTIENETVLVRVDYNIPKGDYSRIDASFKTLKQLLNKNNKLILLSHYKENQSLEFLIPYLSERLFEKVVFAKNLYEKNLPKLIHDNKIVLLENIRFHTEEKEYNEKFIKYLASLCTSYVNEAFATSHRKHSSMLVHKYKKHAYGYLFQEEMRNIYKLSKQNNILAILSGSKLETKLPLLKKLSLKNTVHNIAVGGLLGIQEKKKLQDIDKVVLPVDYIDKKDIGFQSIRNIIKLIDERSTVLLNGPLGVFEESKYEYGTFSILKYIAQRTTEKKLYSFLGGGDTLSAIKKAGLKHDNFSYVSTGGGAFLHHITNLM